MSESKKMSEILASPAKLLTELPEALQTEIKEHVLTVPDTFSVKPLLEYPNWLYHEGNITVDGNLSNDLTLIVKGNLSITGTYSDNKNLIVLGDCTAAHVFNEWTLLVTGDLHAPGGLVYANYNDHIFRVGGNLTARAYLVNDKDAYCKKENMQANIKVSDLDVYEEWPKLIETFTTDLLLRDLDVTEAVAMADISYLNLMPDYAECLRRACGQEQLFRTKPVPSKLIEHIEAIVLDPDTDRSALTGIDPFLDRLIADYPS